MKLVGKRTIQLLPLGRGALHTMALNTWLKAIIIICCAVIRTTVSSSDVTSSLLTTTLQPSTASPILINAITAEPAPVNQTTVAVSTPSISPSRSFSSSSMSMFDQSPTSQDVMMTMISTQIDEPVLSTMLPSFSSSAVPTASPIPNISMLPTSLSSAIPTSSPIPTSTAMLSLVLETTLLSDIGSSPTVPMATVALPSASSVFQDSSRYIMMESSVVSLPESSSSMLLPTPTASSGLRVMTMSSNENMVSSIVPTETMMMMSTSTLVDISPSVLPTPSRSTDDFLTPSSTSLSLPPMPSLPSTSMPSSGEPSLSSSPISSSDAVILPSATFPPITTTPLQSPMQSQSTILPSLSTSLPGLSSSSAVFLTPTPTTHTVTSPQTPGPAEGRLLTTVQWIGIAVAVTAAFIILCVVVWWLIRDRSSGSKHKPTYTKDNVTVDLSRSTSNDPKDVWRNSLLLESMSTRIVVPQEDDDDEMLQSIDNYGFEGISDEEDRTDSSPKEVPLTKL